MLDELFFKGKANKTSINYILFSFVLTLIAFVTSLLLFGKNASIATILITTILLMPAVMRLFREEELIVRKEGFRNIIKNHSYIFNIFLMLFLGTFLAFFFLQLIFINKPDLFETAFDYQINFIESNRDLTSLFTDEILTGNSNLSEASAVLSLLYKNLLLILLCFIFSFFYGSGGIFLIVITASVFSTIILYAMKSSLFFLPFTIVFTILFVLLLVPLITSSISGGILSNAFISERVRKRYFKNVLKDAATLFMFSIILAFVLTLIWMIILRIVIPLI